ncbi:MAG: TFIIB-type zinc ribbon-containing protein [Thermoanaerobaculales bacterium]
MVADLRRWVERIADAFKRRFYGPTFRCPVCHFVLAAVDADGNGLLVCPVCGAVLEIESVYGHIVPVVLDMELLRPQPKARLHPLATHLPIGLFPFALLGALLLFAASIAAPFVAPPVLASIMSRAPVVATATLVLLVVSVVFSLATLASGLWDWNFRYRRRSYRQIRVKIVFAIVFLVLGAAAIALQVSGLVFAAGTGLVQLSSPLALLATVAYLAALTVNMLVIGTLGHIGGTLVYGR